MRTRRLILGVLTAVLVLSPGAVVAQSVDADVAEETTKLVTLALKDAPVAEAVALLFKSTGYDYRIDEGVNGKIVAMDIKNVPFERALKALAEAAKFEYKIEDGIYVITPAQTASSAAAQPAEEAAGKTEGAEPSDAGPSEAPVEGAVGDETGGSSSGPSSPTDMLAEPGDALPDEGVSDALVEQESAPVYYGQWPEPYLGYIPPREPYRLGSITVLPGYSSSIIIGGETTVKYSYRAPLIPGRYSADVSRFRERQSAIRGRPVWQPSYNW